MSGTSKAVYVATSLEEREGLEGGGRTHHSAVKMLQMGAHNSAHIVSSGRHPVRREKFEKELFFPVSRCGTFVNTLKPPPTSIYYTSLFKYLSSSFEFVIDHTNSYTRNFDIF